MKVLCCLLAVVLLLAANPSQASSLRDLETKGIFTDAESGQLANNVWSGLSRNDALMLVDALPDRFASPGYYDIARRLLLSDAPALPAAKPNPKASAANPDTPDMLIARLDKLLDLGALRDAQNLYDAVVPEDVGDFNLAFRSLEILMLRGQLSAACLDLQTMQEKHNANPRWQELNQLCRIKFATGADQNALLAKAKFIEYPILGGLLHGRGVTSLRNLSTQDLAFAVALDLVNVNTMRLMTQKAGSLPPLLLSVLYNLDTEGQNVPEKSCLAIEALRRGMISTRELITLYEKPHFDSDLLLNNLDTAPAGVHPCLVPTIMYQRIASAKEAGPRNQAIRVALDIMKDLPDAAFWPMALYFQDFDVRAVVNKRYLWRATRIVAYEKDRLPADWASGWGGESGRGVSPFWPVQAIVSPASESLDDLNLWRQQWPSEARRLTTRDPLIPLLLGQSLAPEGDRTSQNHKSKLDDYENIKSLTFSRSYSIPSYGLTQRLSDVIEKEQTGQSVALLLIGYGAIPPDQVIPQQMALVIKGLNKAGLGQYARRFALEVLR